MTKFKIGDRVVITTTDGDGYYTKGQTGTIDSKLLNGNGQPHHKVVFDHDGDYWFVSIRNMVLTG